MAFTADTGLITAAMAQCPSSTAKTAFIVDITSLQAEIQNQTANLSDAAANKLNDMLMAWSSTLADELRDHEDS